MEDAVLEEITARTIAKCHEQTELIRKCQFLLKVPRMYDEYIKRNGVD